MGEGTQFTQDHDYRATSQAVAGKTGPHGLTPYILLGKPELGIGELQNYAYRKNLGRDDSAEPGKLKGGYQNNEGGNIFLKRASIFVQPLKLYDLNVKMAPAPYDFEESEDDGDWVLDARDLDFAEQIYSRGTLALDLDTLSLYEGQDSIQYLSTIASEQMFDPTSNPSPVRGIPVRFQKIYFYGSPAMGPYDAGWTGPDDYATKGRSDGRGSLFSAQVLIADPINMANHYDYDAGRDQISGAYDPEGSQLDVPDQFKFLAQKGFWDYTTNTWNSAKDRYHKGKGMSSNWRDNAFSTDAGEPTLVVGDGAIGYNDFNLQALLNLNTTLQSPYALALEFFRTEVVLCVPSGDAQVSITGFVPFQPRPDQYDRFKDLMGEASGALPLIYDIRNPPLSPLATGSEDFSITTVTSGNTLNSDNSLFLDNTIEYNKQGATWDKSVWGTARGRLMEDLEIRPDQYSGAATFLAGDILVRPPASGFIQD